MSDNYFKTGLENLKKIDGTAGSNVIENLVILLLFGPLYH